MELTLSLYRLTLFVHNLFWWLLSLSLLLHVGWLPVVLLVIFSSQTLLLLVWVLKGPHALGLTVTEPNGAQGAKSTVVQTAGRAR